MTSHTKEKGGLEAGVYLVAGPSNNGGEDSTGSIISSESSLDQARAIVTHEGGSFVVVTHGWAFVWSKWSGFAKDKRKRLLDAAV